MSKPTNKFFDNEQKEITHQKLELYNGYIKQYAITLLMANYFWWKIFIADLFAWWWYNWTEKWSPLLLIDTLNELLTNTFLLNKFSKPEAIILFNDKENKSNLENNLKTYWINPNIKINLEDKDFNVLLSELKPILNNTKIPKFFFLDQFSYSTVSFSAIKDLFKLKNTEILLFSPVIDLHRFVNAENIKSNEKHITRKVIEDFTTKWVWDHYNWDIYELCNDIIHKLKKELNSEYIRYVLLDDWNRKNALFYITGHPLWLIKFNNVAVKLWDYWIWRVDIKKIKSEKSWWFQICLFSEKEMDSKAIDKYKFFECKLLELLDSKECSNKELIIFSAINWIETKETDKIIRKLKAEWKIEIRYVNWWTNRSLYISDGNWNTIKSLFKLK